MAATADQNKPGFILVDSPERSKLRDHFVSHPASTHTKRWDDLWVEGFLPWDRGLPNPALIDTLSQRKDLLPSPLRSDGSRKKALVPGCGRGYDVLLLSSFGYDAYGLEASDNALNACRELEKEGRKEYEPKDSAIGKGSVTWVSGDFFGNDWTDSISTFSKGFDLIYDYTFLCALPYELRSKWALRQSQLLVQDGGRLVCLEFPTTKPVSSGGPPWALPPLVYEELLKRPGDDVLYDADGVIQATDRGSTDGALERIAHWQPERTHAIGQGADWVSIWKHK